MTALCCLGLPVARAQMGTMPPEYFMNYTNLCDNTPWKLVFADDFNGSQINTTKWITYGSWQNMPGGDNEHWTDARSGNDYNFIFRDYNVVVNNGTCKLRMRRETNSWMCTSCSEPMLYRKHFSAGMIATRRNLPNGTDISYNTAKMEARIKFPVFSGAWCAFWTWHGTRVNEIDMAEAWGGGLLGSNQRRNKYGTHAWGPSPFTIPPEPNPLNLPYDAALGDQFPNQGWWNYIFSGNYHKQDNWHIYTTEWDDNVIRFYLDGGLINTFWKYVYVVPFAFDSYNYPVSIGSLCNPQPLTPYYIKYGYPYNTQSSSQVLLWGRVDDRVGLSPVEQSVDSVLYPGILGEMEIDYVRIWQRHPEADNHTDICDLGQPKPKIQGPDWACNPTLTYTVSNPVPNSVFVGWGYSNHFSQAGASSNASITLSRNNLSAFNDGYINYKYQVPGCPVQEVTYKVVSCNLQENTGPYGIYSVRTTQKDGRRKFQFFETTYFANYEDGPYLPSFEWDIAVVDGNDDCNEPVYYKRFGQFVSTPFLEGNGNENYCVKWQVKITDPQKNVIEKSGERNFNTPGYQQANDSAVAYFNAYISRPDDYEQAVYNRVSATTVSEDEYTDTVFMRNMVEKIRTEELAPYLLLDDMPVPAMAQAVIPHLSSTTKVFPNPAAGRVTLIPGDRFVDGAPVSVAVYDLTGRLRQREVFNPASGKVGELDISRLPAAMYIIELKQGNTTERYKIIKTDE